MTAQSSLKRTNRPGHGNSWTPVQPNAPRSWVKKAWKPPSPWQEKMTPLWLLKAPTCLYHLFVALRSRQVSLEAVAEALEARQGMSGVEEKARRKD